MIRAEPPVNAAAASRRSRGQAGVIEPHLLARGAQRVAGRLRARVRRRVDDPGPAQLARGAHQLGVLVGDGPQVLGRQLDQRPVEVAQHHGGVTQAEALHDLLPHGRRGGGGQGQPDGRAEGLGLGPEHHVVRPEVTAPLADQVRLVDGEQTRPGALQRLAGLLVSQLLGRQEHERIRVAGGQERRRVRAGRLLRVEHDSRQARRAQVGELIILQRDQRRHDDRRAAAQQPAQLVDGRLPAARRQHGQRVAAVGQGLDRGPLAGAELLEAETIAGQLLDHVSPRQPCLKAVNRAETPRTAPDSRTSLTSPTVQTRDRAGAGPVAPRDGQPRRIGK